MKGVSRRAFLQSSLAGGALLIGFRLGPLEAAGRTPAFQPNAWVRVDSSGEITVRVASSEMGQGVMTAIPMLLAEELEADWSRVRARTAPADAAYARPDVGRQLTGDGSAVRAFWQPLREAGAAARMMLLSAAAAHWGVDEASCHARLGEVVHGPSGRRLGYGDLVEAAAARPLPATVLLKEPAEFSILGRPRKRLDTPPKVDGSAGYAQDVSLPGMLTATVLRCPVFGGRVARVDRKRSLQVPGVADVVVLEDRVAVLADGFWPALKGREALDVEWYEGPNATLSSAAIRERFAAAVDDGIPVRAHGETETALQRSLKRVEAVYEVPYLAHACMEPMSCAAHVRSDGCDLWVGTQAQTRTQESAMRLTGLPRRAVRVHTLFLGGGFGRRAETDFVEEAVALSRRSGRPVKVIWTREDDLRHDHYRPAAYNRLRGGVDAEGLPIAWSHRIAAPSIGGQRSAEVRRRRLDAASVEGAKDLPYAIPHLEVTYAMVTPEVPVGRWRSAGHSQNAYVTECFLDELAAAGGRDPYELRRLLLGDMPRHRAVLDLAAAKARWGEPLPNGRARGIAVAGSSGSFVAQVAEVSLVQGRVRVHRVVCAIDCGMTVNPATIEAQMEGGIAYGLTAALKGEITVENGRVVQGNFHDYELLRMDEMPEVEVHIVASDDPPGGVGAAGTAPVAPAVANAVFALTGRPVRRLPIRV